MTYTRSLSRQKRARQIMLVCRLFMPLREINNPVADDVNSTICLAKFFGGLVARKNMKDVILAIDANDDNYSVS